MNDLSFWLFVNKLWPTFITWLSDNWSTWLLIIPLYIAYVVGILNVCLFFPAMLVKEKGARTLNAKRALISAAIVLALGGLCYMISNHSSVSFLGAVSTVVAYGLICSFIIVYILYVVGNIKLHVIDKVRFYYSCYRYMLPEEKHLVEEDVMTNVKYVYRTGLKCVMPAVMVLVVGFLTCNWLQLGLKITENRTRTCVSFTRGDRSMYTMTVLEEKESLKAYTINTGEHLEVGDPLVHGDWQLSVTDSGTLELKHGEEVRAFGTPGPIKKFINKITHKPAAVCKDCKATLNEYGSLVIQDSEGNITFRTPEKKHMFSGKNPKSTYQLTLSEDGTVTISDKNSRAEVYRKDAKKLKITKPEYEDL